MELNKLSLAVNEALISKHPANSGIHPSAPSAYAFVKSCPDIHPWTVALKELFDTGDVEAQVLWPTLSAVLDGRPVSDRDILGLAWWMWSAMDAMMDPPEENRIIT